MAKINPRIASQINSLSKTELEKLVLKAASKDKSFHDYLLVNYFEQNGDEADLYEDASTDLELLFDENKRGIPERKQAKILSECIQTINEFSKNCKNKKLETDLVVKVLEYGLNKTNAYLGTCFTIFDHKIYLLVKKLMKLVEEKIHEDYKIEYEPKINEYLNRLHGASSHLDYVYDMPKKI